MSKEFQSSNIKIKWVFFLDFGLESFRFHLNFELCHLTFQALREPSSRLPARLPFYSFPIRPPSPLLQRRRRPGMVYRGPAPPPARPDIWETIPGFVVPALEGGFCSH